MRSPRPRYPRCRHHAVVPRRRCSRICWYRSTATTRRSIGRARSMPGMGLISTGRPCVTGLARRCGCWHPSSGGSDVTSSPPRRSTATTRRCRCCQQVSAGPRPEGSGSTFAMTGHTVERAHQRLPTSSAPIAVASIRQDIWRTLRASCRRWSCRARGALRSARQRSGPSRQRGIHRGGVLGTLLPQVLRCVGQQEVVSRQRGNRPHRRFLPDRGQGALRPGG
jgi:hypothetical protein